MQTNVSGVIIPAIELRTPSCKTATCYRACAYHRVTNLSQTLGQAKEEGFWTLVLI